MAKTTQRLLAYRRTITIIAVIIFLYLSFMIIRPFLVTIIGAAILAYLFYPFYKYLVKHLSPRLPKESLAAFITVFLIILIVLIPMAIITALLTNEARGGYLFLQQVVNSPNFSFDLPPYLAERIGDPSQFKQPLVNLASQFILWLQEVLKRIPGAFLNVFLTVFSIYFFLKGGKGVYKFLQSFFPLSKGRYQEIFVRFDELTRGMVLGQIVVGVIHGILSWFAYSVLGVPNPVLWAFLTAIISIIPVLGSGLVWFPIAIYLLVAGYATDAHWKGIALLLYGTLLMSTIDNMLKPKIIGDSARIHPLIILFGILGGIQLVGLPGILLGPLVLTLFDIVMGIFREVI